MSIFKNVGSAVVVMQSMVACSRSSAFAAALSNSATALHGSDDGDCVVGASRSIQALRSWLLISLVPVEIRGIEPLTS